MGWQTRDIAHGPVNLLTSLVPLSLLPTHLLPHLLAFQRGHALTQKVLVLGGDLVPPILGTTWNIF
jgi:hypothetical protein